MRQIKWGIILIALGLCVIFFVILPLLEPIKDFFPKNDDKSLITFHYICLIPDHIIFFPCSCYRGASLCS